MVQIGWLAGAVVSAFVATAAEAQTTTRVSVASGGTQASNESRWPAISGDGRYVAFVSDAPNLVPGDTTGLADVFVRDRQNGATERVSVDSGGAQANGESSCPSISADGRYVAFSSVATNLVPGDTNGFYDLFVHDRQGGTTQRISVGPGGAEGNDGSYESSISADGRFVAFLSAALNLVPGGTFAAHIFVWDRTSGMLEVVSVDSLGTPGNNESRYPSISGDGRFVAFRSFASNLVPADSNGTYDTFVRDRQSGTTERVSVATGGAQQNFWSYDFSSISADGRYVAFSSGSSNLVPGNTNDAGDVFLRDIALGQTSRLSVDSSGAQGNNESAFPSISADGRYVAFYSYATNLVSGDLNGFSDIFVHDRQMGTTQRASISSGGAQGNGHNYYWPSISADGRFVAFRSFASTLVAGDSNGVPDIFVHDRQGIPFAVTSFCFGDGTGGPCPCDNTGQAGHGCENSISTGGALLVGTGDALLSSDTLQLIASSERPTAFSLFWQGGSEIAPRPFGDGVGCMGPPLKRMFSHNAVGGVVTAPQGADLPVSVRSAAVGDPIAPGTIRFYHVFYRDPDTLFCPDPAGATFNTTGGLRVLWGQ